MKKLIKTQVENVFIFQPSININSHISSFKFVEYCKEELEFQQLETTYPKVLPKSRMGQAITYAYTLWPRMRNYLKNGRLKIDNNLAYPKVLIIWWKMPSDQSH